MNKEAELNNKGKDYYYELLNIRDYRKVEESYLRYTGLEEGVRNERSLRKITEGRNLG